MAVNRRFPTRRLRVLQVRDLKKGLLSATNTRDLEEAPPRRCQQQQATGDVLGRVQLCVLCEFEGLARLGYFLSVHFILTPPPASQKGIF
jgi:hypothetical protein